MCSQTISYNLTLMLFMHMVEVSEAVVVEHSPRSKFGKYVLFNIVLTCTSVINYGIPDNIPLFTLNSRKNHRLLALPEASATEDNGT